MNRAPVLRAIDDNRALGRGLPMPVRLVHWVLSPVVVLWAWAGESGRRWYARPMVAGLIGFVVLFPFDGPISRTLKNLPIGGDVKREILTIQQFGGISSLVLVGLLVWLLDRARWRRLHDLTLAAVSTWGAVAVLKILIGRPRPRFDRPWTFLGPFRRIMVDPQMEMRHSWEVWGNIASKLWSMPSSHTSAAAALAAFLMVSYPKLKWLGIGWVAIVGLARVLVGAHYPTDVVVGACIGFMVSLPIVEGGYGQRLADRLSKLFGRAA